MSSCASWVAPQQTPLQKDSILSLPCDQVKGKPLKRPVTVYKVTLLLKEFLPSWNPVAGRRGNLFNVQNQCASFLSFEGGRGCTLSGLGDLGSLARGWTQVRCGGSSASSHSTPRGVLLPVPSALPCGAFAISQQLDGVYTVMIPGPPGGWAQGRGISSVLQSRSKTVSRPDTQSQEKLASVIIVWLNYMLGSSSWAFKIRSLIIFNYDSFFC